MDSNDRLVWLKTAHFSIGCPLLGPFTLGLTQLSETELSNDLSKSESKYNDLNKLYKEA